MFGAGVFWEAEFLLNNKKIVWGIDVNKNIWHICKLDYSKRLSIEETKKRVLYSLKYISKNISF